MHEIVDILINEPTYHPDNFIIDVPLHLIPETEYYNTYWRQEFERCILGYWHDGRYMPPQLYFYINHFRILLNDNKKGKKSKAQVFTRPLLRDVEWIVFYNYLICRGFSGFADDLKYSCNKDLLLLDLNIEDVHEDLLKPDGTLKEYIDAREYLYNLHTNHYTTPLYDNEALNMCMMTSRGKGKSWIGAALTTHEFVLNGAKSLQELYTPSTISVQIVAQEKNYCQDTLDKFLQWFENPPYDYEEEGTIYPSPFYVSTIGSLRSTPERITQGIETYYIDNEGKSVKKIKGTKSTFSIKTVNKDALGTVGKRTSLTLFEEIGKSTNLLEFHSSNEHTQNTEFKFGTTIYIGTGGDIEKVQSAKKIFENSAEYNCISFKDTWSENLKTDRLIGLFLPKYLGELKFLDNRNLTDYVKGKAYYLQEIENKRQRGESQYTIDAERMNNPLYPTDIFLNKKGNVFPSEIEEHLRQIVLDGRSTIGNKGWLVTANNKKGVEFVNDIHNELYHIDTFPISSEFKNNPKYIKGCVKIWEHPMDNMSEDLYRIGYDTVHYDMDESMYNVDSLACMYVYKGRLKDSTTPSDTIVAEYIGRVPKTSHINQMAELLSKYYNNAKIMMETNVQANLAYFNVKKLTYLLAPHPTVLFNNKYNSNSSTVQQYGYIKTPKLAIDLEQWLNEWLTEERGVDINGNKIYNYHSINSTGLLQELISYQRGDDNFDRINAMFAIMVSYKAEDYEQKNIEERNKFLESLMKELPNKYKRRKLQLHDS
jgi:hypothetical protein